MEIGQFLRSQANARGQLPLSVIQFPSKRFGFVGSVPVDLMWEYESATDEDDCTDVAAVAVVRED